MADSNVTPRDPTHELVQQRNRLDSIFAPKSVALIGASERPGSVGRTVLWNLISNPFGGTVYPVNATRPSVLGIKAYPSVSALPEVPELAVITTPAPTVPALVRECAQVGVRGLVIISAGFKEIGEEGVRLEQEIIEIARASGIRLIGPNCLGVMRPQSGLNATFANGMARPGSVGFISQSGALLTAILDWSLRERVGFSCFASLGSMLDVSFGDLIDYLGDDPHTRSILIYMETIGDAKSFLSAARQVALRKPVIVIKAGRTAEAAKAAASHTGSLAGSDEVLSAAFRRVGVLRVDNIADLFHMAETLARQPRPEGKRLTIVTNAGGPGVLATDSLVTGGGQLSPLSDETRKQLDAFLPPQWSHNNPVDILGDADPERYARTLDVVAEDEQSDGMLVILTPQDMTEPTKTADRLKPYAQKFRNKPVIASWMGGTTVATGEQILNEAGIPTFAYPDTAAKIFNYMWRYAYNLRGLYETPTLPRGAEDARVNEEAHRIIDTARDGGRTLLTEEESKRLLAAYGIPVVQTVVAQSADEAVAAARKMGFPVVVKLNSTTITHKSDVDGVRLDLRTEEAVRAAYEGIQRRLEELGKSDAFEGVSVQQMVKLAGNELILGSTLDPQFGPVVLFGAGGTLVEVFKDRALALPPLTTTLARRAMEQTKVWHALQGVRGRSAVDLEALAELMVRFGQLVIEQRMIKEIDINPLLASSERLIALDARVVLHPPDVKEADIPQPAITPYPLQYVKPWKLRDGQTVRIRPIRPEDEDKVVAFHKTLSEESVYMRYAQALHLSQRTAHDRLARICFIDYAREMALVVETDSDDPQAREIIGIGRLTRVPGTTEAEYAILVADRYQRQGLGSELLGRLIGVGRDWGLERIFAEILPRNFPMQKVSTAHGFVLQTGGPMVRALKTL